MPLSCSCPVCGQPVGELPVTILPERGMVVANGKFVILTGHEMLILERLVEVFPRVLSKDAAVDWLYQLQPEGGAEPKIVDVYICKIRKKLTPLGVRIDTLWGRGYALALSERPHLVREQVAA